LLIVNSFTPFLRPLEFLLFHQRRSSGHPRTRFPREDVTNKRGSDDERSKKAKENPKLNPQSLTAYLFGDQQRSAEIPIGNTWNHSKLPMSFVQQIVSINSLAHFRDRYSLSRDFSIKSHCVLKRIFMLEEISMEAKSKKVNHAKFQVLMFRFVSILFVFFFIK